MGWRPAWLTPCRKAGVRQLNDVFFDTLRFELPDGQAGIGRVRQAALAARMNFRYRDDGTINVALDETTDADDVAAIVSVLARISGCGLGRSGRNAGLSGRARTHVAVSHASGLQRASFRNADDAVSPGPRAKGHRTRHVDDSAGLVHDEAERRFIDDAHHVAGVLEAPSVCPDRAVGRVSAGAARAGSGAVHHHGLRGRLAPTQFRSPGGIRGPDGDSRVPPGPR